MGWINAIVAIVTIILFFKCRSYKSYSEDLEKQLKKEKNDATEIQADLQKQLKFQTYRYDYITKLYPELGKLVVGDKIVLGDANLPRKVKDLFETVDLINSPRKEQYQEIQGLKNRIHFLESSKSNLSAIPYMTGIVADYETYELEVMAKQLDWGYSVERSKKVASIREIRRAAKEMVERNLESKYQLQYLLELFPNLQDVIETDYKQLPLVKVEELSDYDAARDWISKEEYQSLSTVERNQLALDRYKESHNKTKWQIGRDYELFVGYKYQQKGYKVDYFGSYMGMEDLGRDLIAKKDGKTLIIQCKYWGHEKVIHEKHITQLYGTMASYIIEQGIPSKNVTGVLVTNITLSEQAKKMADYLKIQYVEKFEKGDYPCIKCNIGNDEYGKTYIYHLPFDQQYDSTKIDAPGEFFAMTVKEAEEKGFRRAFKWFGS